MITPAQKAYALLWRSTSTDRVVHKARKLLLESLTHEQQREAIAWVIEEEGAMETREIIAADMRAEIFPRRSV